MHVVARAAVLQGLERRRCGAQDDGDIKMFGAGDCQISRGIAQALLLLEGLVMFFVDDDQSEVRHWSEHSGPCANDKLCRALLRGSPCAQSLSVA